MRLLSFAALALLAAGCSASIPAVAPGSLSTTGPDGEAAFDPAAVESGVRAVLAEQVLAWNSGSVRGFMDGYERSDSLAFLSGGSVRIGWEESYYAYVRAYPDQAAMGVLTFDDLSVRPLSARHALVWGRWRLRRAADTPGGLFTLLFENGDEGWRVAHDHTSSE